MLRYGNFEVGYISDIGENEGGFFCEVYSCKLQDRIDFFCIHLDELKENSDIDYWISLNVNNNYNEWLKLEANNQTC